MNGRPARLLPILAHSCLLDHAGSCGHIGRYESEQEASRNVAQSSSLTKRYGNGQ